MKQWSGCLLTIVLMCCFVIGLDEKEMRIREAVINKQKVYLYFIEKYLSAGNWSYFELRWAGPIRVILVSTTGDADLYLSSTKKHPGYDLDEYEMLSTTCGVDVVDVPQIMQRPVYVGVYGHPSNAATNYRILFVMLEKTNSKYVGPIDIEPDIIYSIHEDVDLSLRSRTLYEKMATIVNSTTFLRENPFPFFVNAAVLRLCEVFRDECNELRSCVVRVMDECSTELRLVFSNDEVARRILKVSHSNDPWARSLTLQLLAKLASIMAENKQARLLKKQSRTYVHHLIVMSIDSEEEQERLSAIVATEAYVGVSRFFSQIIFEKLSVTFFSPFVSPCMKVALVHVFANMRADVETIMKVFALGRRILNEAYNEQLMLAMIKSLTTLAASCRFAVSEMVILSLYSLEQIAIFLSVHQSILLTLLIEKLKVSKENRTLSITILRNMKRLSSSAHMLTESHINASFILNSLRN
ncbi:unnamed protein product [Thelazia callipaeda]|uniref:Integrator complex subunit 7 n=1 Tax=Thelazia callipaeda TaxID=103827 RepID=A0A0N5D5X4_THECL|nr:unnamed protein product [Thelazia callipaeda]